VIVASKLKGKDPSVVEAGKTKMLIFGASGVGKTWFSLGFPTPYYIDTENGADLKHYQERLKVAGGAYLGTEDGSLDYDVIIDQMQALATEKHPYKTLIIDSITKLFQTAIANEQERLGDKDAFGASKKPAVAGMRRLVNWATKLDMNILFLAHEVPEWGVNPKSGMREEIGKIPDVWDKLVYELDLGLRIIRRGKEYPATAIVHKSRLLGFPLNDSFPLDYNTFSEKYGKNYIEAETKTIVLATPEQVSKMNTLLDIFKIPFEEQEKMLTKGSASKWEELESSQIDKYITFLTAKIEGKK
jgi:hypothetical protein